MKKKILSIAAILVFGFVNAQETRFGLKAGLNLSNLTGDVEKASAKGGFHAGGFVGIKLSDKFSLQPELLYSLQGTNYVTGGSTYIDFKIAYLNIPVMAKYYVAHRFSFEAGPQIGFLLSAKAQTDSETLDVKEDFKSTDFGFNVGAGYDVTKNINIGARYGFSFINVNINSDGSSDGVKNSNIAISIGYKF